MNASHTLPLDALCAAARIVRPALASVHTLVPALTRFNFFPGRLVAFDGRVTLSTPFPAPASLPAFAVHGPSLLPLLERAQAQGAGALVATFDAGEGTGAPVRVGLRAGRMRVTLPCFAPDAALLQCNIPGWDTSPGTPVPAPSSSEGTRHASTRGAQDVRSLKGKKRPAQVSAGRPTEGFVSLQYNGLTDALRVVRPFIGSDASRPWTLSTLLCPDGALYATNNVVLVRTSSACGHNVPIALPVFAVDEVLRIEAPLSDVVVREDATLLLVRFSDGTWLRSSLTDTSGWPDVAEVLARAHGAGAILHALPAEEGERAEWVDALVPYCADPALPLITVRAAGLATATGDTFATLALPLHELRDQAQQYHAEPLRAVLTLATHIGWDAFPRVPWVAQEGRVHGVLLGVVSR